MNTIKFNAQAYHIKVSQIERAASNLTNDSDLKTDLEETDVASVKALSKAIKKWQQLLKSYESSLHAEVSKLNAIGSEIEETDQKLARYLDNHFSE